MVVDAGDVPICTGQASIAIRPSNRRPSPREYDDVMPNEATANEERAPSGSPPQLTGFESIIGTPTRGGLPFSGAYAKRWDRELGDANDCWHGAYENLVW